MGGNAKLTIKGGITQKVTITSPDGVAAAGGTPTKTEFDRVVTLVNELKAKLNAASPAKDRVEIHAGSGK